MKSMWIWGFVGCSEPTELEGFRHGDERGFLMLPLLPHPAEGRSGEGGTGSVQMRVMSAANFVIGNAATKGGGAA